MPFLLEQISIFQNHVFHVTLNMWVKTVVKLINKRQFVLE